MCLLLYSFPPLEITYNLQESVFGISKKVAKYEIELHPEIVDFEKKYLQDKITINIADSQVFSFS